MSRLSDCFQARRDARKKVLITYAMAGYPNKAGTVNMINGMIEGGADIVEIGFPFSDPLADGKLIQKASTIALGHKMNLDAYFKIVSSVRKSHPKTPLLMMTYANILHIHVGMRESAKRHQMLELFLQSLSKAKMHSQPLCQ